MAETEGNKISASQVRKIAQSLSVQDIGTPGSPKRFNAVFNTVGTHLPNLNDYQFTKRKAAYTAHYADHIELIEGRRERNGVVGTLDHIPEIKPSRVASANELDLAYVRLASALVFLNRPDVSKVLSILGAKEKRDREMFEDSKHLFTTTGLELEIIRTSNDLIKTWQDDAKMLDLLQHLGIKISYDGIREISLPYSDISLQLKAVEELFGMGMLRSTDILGIHPNFGFKRQGVIRLGDPSPLLLQFAADAANLFEVAEWHPESAKDGAPVIIYEPKPISDDTFFNLGFPIRYKQRNTVVEFRSIPMVTNFHRFSSDIKKFGELADTLIASKSYNCATIEEENLSDDLGTQWRVFYNQLLYLFESGGLSPIKPFFDRYADIFHTTDGKLPEECSKIRGEIVHLSWSNPSFRKAAKDLMFDARMQSRQIKKDFREKE